jgi:hypothetical protein
MTKKMGTESSSISNNKILIGLGILAFIGTIGAAVIGKWPFTPTPDNSIYRVRVTVVDDKGTPTEEAKVWSSFGGEPKRVAGGWQFDIPAASKPKDGKLTIFASKESAFLKGEAPLTLDKEVNPALTINLKRDASAKVRGQIVDNKNRGIAGVKVFVVGYDAEAVTTKAGGNFELPAHAAIDQQVLVHAEKQGYRGADRHHPAGDTSLKMTLGK